MQRNRAREILTNNGICGVLTTRKSIFGKQMLILKHNNIEYIIKTERGLRDIIEGIA
jgi:hypothetical protein